MASSSTRSQASVILTGTFQKKIGRPKTAPQKRDLLSWLLDDLNDTDASASRFDQHGRRSADIFSGQQQSEIVESSLRLNFGYSWEADRP